MGATIDVIAARTSLHRASVSRILNGKGGAYSAHTRERVIAAAREVGYQPNLLARALVTGTTHTISLWMVAQHFYSPYFGLVRHTLYQEGVRRGYRLLTEQFYDVVDTAGEAERQSMAWPVDGVLAYDVPRFAAVYRRSASRQKGVVTLGEWCDPESDHVRIDLVPPTIEAVHHLYDTGNRSIAFVTPLLDTPRGQAYSGAMAEAGLPSETIHVEAASRTGGYEALRGVLGRGRVPEALLCFNDEVAIGCYAALAEAGRRVPDDVRLVGCDGLEDVRYLPCPLTSIHIPVDAMSALAWDVLLARLDDPTSPARQETLTPALDIRASSTGGAARLPGGGSDAR